MNFIPGLEFNLLAGYRATKVLEVTTVDVQIGFLVDINGLTLFLKNVHIRWSLYICAYLCSVSHVYRNIEYMF